MTAAVVGFLGFLALAVVVGAGPWIESQWESLRRDIAGMIERRRAA